MEVLLVCLCLRLLRNNFWLGKDRQSFPKTFPPLRIMSPKLRPNAMTESNDIVLHRSGDGMADHNFLYLPTRLIQQANIYII